MKHDLNCSAANYYGSRVVAYAFRGRLRTLRKLKQTTRMKNSEVHFSCKKNWQLFSVSANETIRNAPGVIFRTQGPSRWEQCGQWRQSNHRHTLESSFLPDTDYCPLHLSRVRHCTDQPIHGVSITQLALCIEPWLLRGHHHFQIACYFQCWKLLTVSSTNLLV